MTFDYRSAHAQLALVLVGASCSSGPAAEPTPLLVGPQTVHVDCVAVLGAMPSSAPIPLASVPYSGVARDKYIGDLTDNELGHLCDFLACLRNNGYGNSCYGSGDGPKFRPELSAPLYQATLTCYPIQIDDPSAAPRDYSRESQMYNYRNQFGTCLVGVWEDCFRETLFEPLGAEYPSVWAPACRALLPCGG